VAMLHRYGWIAFLKSTSAIVRGLRNRSSVAESMLMPSCFDLLEICNVGVS